MFLNKLLIISILHTCTSLIIACSDLRIPVAVLDASAKLTDGLLVGSLTSFGNYDECIDTEVRSEKQDDQEKLLFRGQYCIINMVPPMMEKRNSYTLDDIGRELNVTYKNTIVGEIAKMAEAFSFISLRFGICVPSGCTVQDVDKVAKSTGDMLAVNTEASRCEVKKEKEYTPAIITAISILFFLLFMITVGTVIDLYKYYTKAVIKNLVIRTILAFSFFTNCLRFVDTKTGSGPFSCLNGISFLSITWIILGHTYKSMNFQMLINLIQVKNFAKDFAFQVVINASVAIDTFFCMSGLLVCYTTMNSVYNQGRKFSIRFFILHRLWRLYPAYIVVILTVFLGELIGAGPLWHDTTHAHFKACHDNWWTNILFINNFLHAENMCIPQSWFIGTEFQLYIGSLIVLLPMIRWPKAGIILTIISIIICILYSGIDTYVHNYPPTMLFTPQGTNQRKDYWTRFIFRPFVHVGSYCVGILAGYILITYPKLKIPVAMQVIGWGLGIAINLSVLYGIYAWNKGEEPSFLCSIMYASFNRTAWSAGIAWMIVCCATGHGGVFNHILSWKAFVPLGRLTYVTFLIHPLVQIIFVGSIKKHLNLDHFLGVYLFCGHFLITYCLAFIGTMLIEAPCLAIEEIYLPKIQKTSNDIFVPKDGSKIKGTLKTDKNGDIATIVPKTDEETGGIDNVTIVYRL